MKIYPKNTIELQTGRAHIYRNVKDEVKIKIWRLLLASTGMNNVVWPVIIMTIWFSTHIGVPNTKLAKRNKWEGEKTEV